MPVDELKIVLEFLQRKRPFSMEVALAFAKCAGWLALKYAPLALLETPEGKAEAAPAPAPGEPDPLVSMLEKAVELAKS
jgi:hypothetical protein